MSQFDHLSEEEKWLVCDNYSIIEFVEKWGKGSARKLPKVAFVKFGKRKRVTPVFYTNGPTQLSRGSTWIESLMQ